jgi:hypothetical protein
MPTTSYEIIAYESGQVMDVVYTHYEAAAILKKCHEVYGMDSHYVREVDLLTRTVR